MSFWNRFRKHRDSCGVMRKRAKSQQVSVIWDRANHQRGARAKVLEFFPSPYKRVAAVIPTSASEAALRNGKAVCRTSRSV